MKILFQADCKFLAAWLWTVVSALAISAPADRQTSSQTAVGKTIYEVHCAPCHGVNGKGDGIASALLNPRPRNFTTGIFKFRSTESGSLPTDEDLTATINSGLHGTSMPDWAPFIKGDSLKEVIDYVKTFSPRFQKDKPRPIRVETADPFSASSVASGKKVYAKLQCADCHGTDGAGTGAVAKDFQDEWNFETNAVNLTEPWTFRGGATARDIYVRLRTGVDGTPMPSYAGAVSDKEMWNLANYVVSMARKPAWNMNENELREFYAKLEAQAKADPVQRGKYLVRTIGCAGCHSRYTEDLRIIEGSQLSGGLTFDLYPFGKYVTRNLTSDKETGLGNWTDQEIKRAFTQGISRDGRKFLPFPMPWAALAALKEDDQNAIVAYLRTVPAVSHKIPDPDKPNIFAYLWGKFKMLVLKEQIPTPVYPMKEADDQDKPVSQNPSGAEKNFAVRVDRAKEVRP